MKINHLDRYIFFISLCFASINFFRPTVDIFREFGIFPSVIMLNVMGFYYIFTNKLKIISNSVFLFFAIFAIGLMIGIFSFFFFGEVTLLDGKNNILQLTFQGLLFLNSIFVIMTLNNFFSINKNIDYFIKSIPIVLLFNVSIFYLDYFFSIPNIILYLTANDVRPSGLSSEPSFYQAYVSILCLSLINTKITLKIFLLLFLSIISLFLSGQETFIFIFFLFFVIKIIFCTNLSLNIKLFIFFTAIILSFMVAPIVFYFIPTSMESEMVRIGSVFTGVNVLSNAPLGIGIGQFHFNYNLDYFPSEIINIPEINDFINQESSIKANTFNYFLRITLEFSLFGLVLLFFLLYKNLYRALSINSSQSLFAVNLFFAVSVFMMSVDLFAYPLLLISLGVLVTYESSNKY